MFELVVALCSRERFIQEPQLRLSPLNPTPRMVQDVELLVQPRANAPPGAGTLPHTPAPFVKLLKYVGVFQDVWVV